MTYFRSLVLGLALTIAAAPAFAQLSPGLGGGDSGAGGAGGAGAPQPQAATPDIAPPALPGAGLPAPAPVGPVLQKPASGDPTANLFTAIAKGDDTAAQNALAAGADLNAQNQFGETPLDLSIALNRTSITFLLLQTRNELATQGGDEPMGAPWLLNSKPAPHESAPDAAEPTAAPPPAALPEVNGTPNPQAGFLGFNPKD